MILRDIRLQCGRGGALAARRVAFAFVTGTRAALAPRHAARPALDKPFSDRGIAALLDRLAPVLR